MVEAQRDALGLREGLVVALLVPVWVLERQSEEVGEGVGDTLRERD